jgi:hypothetical protein
MARIYCTDTSVIEVGKTRADDLLVYCCSGVMVEFFEHGKTIDIGGCRISLSDFLIKLGITLWDCQKALGEKL